MYWDIIIFAGLGTVGLMIAFMAGWFYFIYQDAKKHDQS